MVKKKIIGTANGDVFGWFGFKAPNVNCTFGKIDQAGEAFFVPDDKWLSVGVGKGSLQERLRAAFMGKQVKDACSLAAKCIDDVGGLMNELDKLKLGASIKKSVTRSWDCCESDCAGRRTSKCQKDDELDKGSYTTMPE